ncbi:hypothetical protein VNI00_015255 [Paramarasmius palmivorus]|uniref:Uncharacterized protein n=1 Tax=Paramarasmius palmivorus TaxID=297713 RepID=A0AAW0BLL2_9AGAR
MNFATASHFVSLYPKTSFIDKRIILLNDPSTAADTVHQEYTDKGWTTATELTAEEALHPNHELSIITRWVGDPLSWIVELVPSEDTVPVAEEGKYKLLKVTSWHLGCLGTDTIRIVFNRIEDRRLEHSYVVSLDAEEAVWGHPCFAESGSKADWETSYEPEYIQQDLAEDSSDGESFMSDSDTSEDSITQMPDFRLYCYSRGLMFCNHRKINGNYDFEEALTEFLSLLHPLMAECHRENDNHRMIRDDLSYIKNAFRRIENDIQMPSGYAICMIFKRVEDVRKTGRSKSIKFHLRFCLTTLSRTVITTCTILVPSKRLHEILSDLAGRPEWSDDLLLEVGVVIRFQSDKDADEQ